MKKLKEKDIQADICSRIRKMGGFVHKISDFSPTYKPYDFFGAYATNPFFIELKKCDAGKSLGFSTFQTHQIAALKATHENSCDLWGRLIGVVIGVVDEEEVVGTPFIHIEEILRIKEEGGKSIDKKRIAELPDFFGLLTDRDHKACP